MKQRVLIFMFVSLLLVGLAGFSGCGSSSSDDPDPLNITGTWVISTLGDFPEMTAVLTHTGTAVAGTVTDQDNYSQAIAGTTEAAAGTEEPRTVTLIINFNDGQIATLVGTVSDNNRSMNGTYTDNFDGSGSWTAILQ